MHHERRRVLVVEDNDKNLKLTRDVLEYAGFTVDGGDDR